MTDRAFDDFLERAKPDSSRTKYDSHPADTVLEAFAYDQLDGSLLSRVSVHVATCRRCSSVVANLRLEMKRLDELLARNIDSDVTIKRATSSALTAPEQFLDGLWGRFRRWIDDASTPSLVRLAATAASLAALIVVTNLAMDRWLVPPVSPFASPAPASRWWVHLYWLLLPPALLLCAKGLRRLSLWWKGKRRD